MRVRLDEQRDETDCERCESYWRVGNWKDRVEFLCTDPQVNPGKEQWLLTGGCYCDKFKEVRAWKR